LEKTKLEKNFMSRLKHMMYILAALGCLICVVIGCAKKQQSTTKTLTPIKEVDFDLSMGKGSSEWKHALANPDDVTRYNIFKSFYEKNLPSKVAWSETPKIPKIIHQIWLGPKNPPAHFFTFREKWQKLHPDWEFRLWTDADLDSLNLSLRDILDASPNFAERSDILRSEILERFGGVYVDVDIDPFQALTELHHKYDFYVGVEYPHKIATTNNMVWAGISIIATRPHHPIMKRWQEYIRARWDKVNETYASPVERVINHTYFPFTFAILDKINDDNLTNMFFPATYFYPLTAEHASKRRAPIRSFREKLYDFLEQVHVMKPRQFSRKYSETLAVHYWGNSWIPTPGEQLKDLQNQLDILKKDFYSLQQKMRHVEKQQIVTQEQKQERAEVGARAG
jgi:mannosyltransferase OCH1-like enzyme